MPRWCSNTNSANATQQATLNQDDSQSIKILIELVKSVRGRVDDLFLIRQAMDVKLRKTKHANTELFEELKSRELARLTKENQLYAGLLGFKQT